jgi:hypothetical protein
VVVAEVEVGGGMLLPEMAGEILGRTVEGRAIKSVHVTTSADGKFAYRIE